MSSTTSASALTRSRSLRQPTAGLNTNNSGSALNRGPVASSSAPYAPRTTSPSRLPKPGGSTIATRARAGTTGQGNGIPSAIGIKSRPTSGIHGRPNGVAVRKTSAQTTAPDQAEPSKTTRPTAIKTSRLTRPTSQSISAPSRPSPTTSKPSATASTHSPTTAETKPANTTSPTRTQLLRTNAHARAKSTATSLTSATVLRPPRPPSAGSNASTPTTATAPTTAGKRPIGRSSTVTTRSVHQRQVSGSAANNASSGLSRSATTTAASTTLKSTRPGAGAVSAAGAESDAQPRLRPAFSTLQQHYSPARNLAPKPLTSTYLAPPSPSKQPANVAISAETARLQAELLQLHLLHRDADAVAAEWHASARERLRSRFAGLVGLSAEVGRDEADAEEARNLAALQAWGAGERLEDKIQLLDAIVSGVWSLGEPGGRYARVVRKFEKWAERMVQSVEARRKAGGLGALMEGDEVAFVGELDPAWKDEVFSMARKLDLWRRQLGQLGDFSLVDSGGDGEQQQQSSLERILAGCRAQVGDMLAELDVMEQIERDAIAQEAAWIRRMNRDDDENDTPGAGAIWRAF